MAVGLNGSPQEVEMAEPECSQSEERTLQQVLDQQTRKDPQEADQTIADIPMTDAPIPEVLDIEEDPINHDTPEGCERTTNGPASLRRSGRVKKPTEKMKQFRGLEVVFKGLLVEISWKQENLITFIFLTFEDESWKEITTSYSVPKSYKEALESEEADRWLVPINDEYAALIENGTWELTQLPENRKTVKNKWVFDIKPAPNKDTRLGLKPA